MDFVVTAAISHQVMYFDAWLCLSFWHSISTVMPSYHQPFIISYVQRSHRFGSVLGRTAEKPIENKFYNKMREYTMLWFELIGRRHIFTHATDFNRMLNKSRETVLDWLIDNLCCLLPIAIYCAAERLHVVYLTKVYRIIYVNWCWFPNPFTYYYYYYFHMHLSILVETLMPCIGLWQRWWQLSHII